MNPPEHALVLSCDEKSQIHALDRTQPGLPMKRGRAGTVTHDYKRHGTTTLFAALNTLDGSVISMCQPRHRQRRCGELNVNRFHTMDSRRTGLLRQSPVESIGTSAAC